VPVEVAHVEGVNHLLVPADTGEVSEYGGLSSKQVSSEATGTIARWLQATLTAAR
jgi:hypothetical protein